MVIGKGVANWQYTHINNVTGEVRMERYTNEHGKECFRNATLETPFDVEQFHEVGEKFNDNTQWALHTDIGSITVLNRRTGYMGEPFDTETGFCDVAGKFWLASGMVDVRYSGAKTIGEAIDWVKSRANTCVGI